MRLLFVSEKLSWPRAAGHDVHTYYMMQCLARLGHEVHLATVREQDPQAIQGADLVSVHHLTGEEFAEIREPLPLTKMQERFRNYWGIRNEMIREVGAHAKAIQADAVIVVGLHVLPYLGAVENAVRIWYAGDEWVWHHWSQFRMFRRSTWSEIKQGIVKGLYERAYTSLVDRVWMVSDADRKAWRWVTGHKQVDVLPNGIDTEHYASREEPVEPHTCVFWGRLDFGPNIQALEWFCRKVWPRVLSREPRAQFRIFGFQPTPQVLALGSKEARITITPNLPDIRSEVRKNTVVVLPFVSGGGIKNKLLEAAAMGKAILCTSRTISGLTSGEAVRVVDGPRTWAKTLVELWQNPGEIQQLGSAARAWVCQAHTWEAVARKAVEEIHGMQEQRRSELVMV